MLPAAVENYLLQHRSRYLEQYFELLRIPSIANLHGSAAGGDGCIRAAEWLVRRLRDLGLAAEAMPTGGPPCVHAASPHREGLPTVLVYGHFDVQPPEPLELWLSDPFQPVIRDGAVYARGASDDKGQLFGHLMAVEAWLRAGGGLPVNVKFLLDGEEEVGSPHLEKLLTTEKHRFAADAAVISDGEFFAAGAPSITYALRGLVYMEVTFRGPSRDVHSGLHGGAVANPANALATLVAAMKNADGRVMIEGFYDDVLPLSPAERAEWAALPMDEKQYAASLGVSGLTGGEKGYSLLERLWARPTLDCNGLTGGYAGLGSKTIIPSSATAKLSMRLVPCQDPRKIATAFESFVNRHTPPGITAEVKALTHAAPVLLDRKTPAIAAAREALGCAFGKAPAMIRCGASVPVTEVFQRILGLDAAMMGFGLPEDNLHSPNERFLVDHFHRGAVACAAFLQSLGGMVTARRA